MEVWEDDIVDCLDHVDDVLYDVVFVSNVDNVDEDVDNSDGADDDIDNSDEDLDNVDEDVANSDGADDDDPTRWRGMTQREEGRRRSSHSEIFHCIQQGEQG